MSSVRDFQLPPFFVYIIESNQVEEIVGRFSEGTALKNVLHFSGVEVKHHTSVGVADFDLQLRRALPFAQQIHKFPILHISAHGSLKGVHLTTGEVVTWRELSQLLMPLHQYCAGSYLLCLSSCEGLNSIQVALVSPDYPLFGVVGTSEVVNWSDNVVGYAAFYHLLKRGKTIRQAVDGMNAASGHATYCFVHGPDTVSVMMRAGKRGTLL